MRCSQLEASDIRGMPDPQNGMTVYLPPSDLPQAHGPDQECPACNADLDVKDFPHQNFYCKGLLFLDEVNRAEDDVMQAIFQLVYDRKVGTYILPEGWSVHCAGNFGKGDSYNVNNFNDEALLDRFCHLEVTTGTRYYEGWVSWMKDNYPQSDKILQFVGFNKDHLIGKVDGEGSFTIQPSPRSWEMVARVDKVIERYEESDDVNPYPSRVIKAVISGLIGASLAAQYERFTCKVTPDDIMKRGVTTNRSILEKLSRNELIGLVHGVGANCKRIEIGDRDLKEMANVCDFIKFVAITSQRDLAVALTQILMKIDSKVQWSTAFISNPQLVKYAKGFLDKDQNSHKSWVTVINQYEELAPLMEKVSNGQLDDLPLEKSEDESASKTDSKS